MKNNLNKMVFGYLPEWIYEAGEHANIRYDLLTHIAVFDFKSTASGAISTPTLWPWNDVIDSASANGVKLHMVVSNFDGADVHNILTTSAGDVLINNIISTVNTYNFNGVNIDFEALYDEDKSTAIVDFLTKLKTALNNVNTGIELSIATPAVNYNNYWDFDGIASAVDIVFIMGYDFYGSWSTATGPVAPLEGNPGVRSILENDYASLASNYRKKVILGVPYYGALWETQSLQQGSTIVDFIDNPYYKDYRGNSNIQDSLWSDTYKNPWFIYQQNSKNYQLWIDTEQNLALKYDIILTKDLGGVGIWALGYDNPYPELWNLLITKFTGSTSIEETFTPNEYDIVSNYPNPFNPSTKIVFNLQHNSNVELSVFNVSGELVYSQSVSGLVKGTNSVDVNLSNKPSGMYIYQIKINGNNSVVKVLRNKMVLLK